MRWIVERMCSENVIQEDAATRCAVLPGPSSQSFKQGESTPSNTPVYSGYRVTIRVEGPRNTVVFAQSVISM